MTLEVKKQELMKLQTALKKANHIYICCMNREERIVSDFFGSEQEVEFVREHFSREKQIALIRSFVDEGVENVICQKGEVDYILQAAIAIRDTKHKLLGAWMILGVDEEQLPQEMYLPACISCSRQETFEEAIALLETVSDMFMAESENVQRKTDSLQELQTSQKQQEHELKKNEVLTEILKLLESENGFAKIAEDILREAGDYLKITSSALLRMNTDDETVDMICEWNCQEEDKLIDRFQNVLKQELPFMTGRPYTISSDSLIPDSFLTFFQKYGIQAGIFLPLTISGKTGMYLSFTMIQERRWNSCDIQFLNDVKRVLQAILVKRITKNSLASSYSSLEAILENAGCGVCIIDIEREKLLYSNEACRKIAQNKEEEEALQHLLIDPKEYDRPVEFYGQDSTHWYELTFNRIHWVDGREVRVCTLYDITHMKRYQKKIEHQANVDYLTGLYNRMRCEQDMKEEIRRAVHSASQGVLLYLDLDDFKNINDGLGHHCGDLLLKNVATSLQEIRGIDAHCYRIGGDEFAILIPYDHVEHLPTIMKRIQAVFLQPWNLDGTDYYCTMSMGTVHFPQDGVKVDQLLQRADIALYEAKQKGKNRIEHYCQESATNPIQRLDLEKNLRLAVDGGCNEFIIYYQPVMKYQDEQMVCGGAEALVRWNSPALGLLSPMEFIPLAEYLGLIMPIGEYVLNEACDRCKYWNDFGRPEYKVSVNLSVVQLLQNNIADTIQRAVDRSGVNPNNLILEVTEGLAVHDMSRMKDVLANIKKIGVGIALDDFGTGYSSLNHIQNMPLDVIKIDRCFVEKIGQDLFSKAFVKSVTELARVLQVKVCIEGVETQEQLAALREVHPDMLQGYLFGRPVTARELEEKYLF